MKETREFMNTYESFTGGYVKLGKASSLLESLEGEIISSISKREGGARVQFKPLCDACFERLTSVFDSPVKYGKESYIIEICDTVTVYYTSEITKLYGAYAIKRMYTKVGLAKGVVYNTPRVEFRCVRCYLPSKDGLDDFLKFIDMLIAFGHNSIMLEIGGAMEYKRHPEINEGWVEYCKIFEEFNGKTEYVQRSSWYPKNAIHSDNGGGGFLTYEELGRLVEHCKARHFEIIPEVPSLSHVDYLLYNHPELSEIYDDHLPNNACPSNEDYYNLIFDVLDEVCEVFHPTRVNICHDEAYIFGYCKRCRGKDAGVLFATHMTRLHDRLAEHGVKTMIWADGISPMEHGGKSAYHLKIGKYGKRDTVNVQGKEYKVEGFKYHTKEQYEERLRNEKQVEGIYVPPKQNSIDFIPRDIEVMDWGHGLFDAQPLFREYGFYHVYGNFSAITMPNLLERIEDGIKGFSFSNWGCNDFEALQRTNTLFSLSYNTLAAWAADYDGYAKEENTFAAADAMYNYFNYDKLSGRHLKILHTTDAVIDHDFFYDGFVIVKEDYRIGDYDIEYTDGTHEMLPIYWGQNIGQTNAVWDKNKAQDFDGVAVVKYIYEPIGESRPVVIDGKNYYEFVTPIEKDVKAVTLKAKDGFNIELLSYTVEEAYK